jgi:glutamate synthase domain-containing protein 3
MKEYQEKKPVLVIGGTAQDFLGEYMAGGILIPFGLNLGVDEPHRASYIGTGMHGGVIYMRGSVNDYQLGKEVGVAELNEEDRATIQKCVSEFATHFGYDAEDILKDDFRKLFPRSLRPYGRLYVY